MLLKINQPTNPTRHNIITRPAGASERIVVSAINRIDLNITLFYFSSVIFATGIIKIIMFNSIFSEYNVYAFPAWLRYASIIINSCRGYSLRDEGLFAQIIKRD